MARKISPKSTAAKRDSNDILPSNELPSNTQDYVIPNKTGASKTFVMPAGFNKDRHTAIRICSRSLWFNV